MERLVFATNNPNKVIEWKSLVKNKYQIVSLAEAGINIDIPEPHETLKHNAIEKSNVIYQLSKSSCVAEDSGLEVNALNGEPGVKSARYAGEAKSSEKNIDKLLTNLEKKKDRSARFKTVICLNVKGNHFIFEGVCNGIITQKRRGTNGFGYDAVFIPDGSAKTFGEMSLDEKNVFSHRKKALDQLLQYLDWAIDVDGSTLKPKET
jgi:XTP/dITP diphosphohydrolase